MTPGKQANVIYSTEYDKNLKPFLLFAHAFAGCDTTSAIFKKGKKSIISLLKKKPDLQALISVFYESNRSIEELYAVSEKIIFHLYGQSITDELTLGELRYRIFSLSAAAFKKEVILASLPPTESALREHTKRVYYQIQQWLGNNLNPDDWGWRRTLFMMIPIMSNAEPAPKELIDKVSCSCKTNCLSARCGCKKSGLKCNKFCKSCQGQSCDNASARSFNLEDDENEDKEDEERDDSDDENDDDGNVYEDENDGEEETTVEDGEQENEAICTGRKTVKNTRSKVSTQKIFCGCRTNCASARCSCRKSSLKCNELCKFCHGDTCNNSINAGVDTNEDSEYETHTKANDKDEETPTEEENEGSSTVRDSSPLDEIYINFEKF